MEKNIMKKCLMSLLTFVLLLQCGCGGNNVPENTVFTLDDLKGKKIGVQLKTTGDILASDVEDAQVQRFNRGRDAVAALQAGEIDAIIIDDGPAKVFVEEFDNVRMLEDAFEEEEYGLVVKKGNQELLDKLNDALATIKENGTLDSISENWIYNAGQGEAYQGQDKASYANGTLVMVTNAEFPPYENVEEDEIVGFDIDLMKAICDELDMKLEVQNIAFDSIISALDREIADVGATAMSITADRLEQADFSEPYTTARQVVLVRDDGK